MSEAVTYTDGPEYLPAVLPLDAAARAELAAAWARIDHGRGVLVRMADLLGGFVGSAGRFGLRQIGMNQAVQAKFRGLAEAALTRAYDVAILGLGRAGADRAPLSRALVMASGAAGGFAGMAGFLPDASFTTLAIMREIARIARDQGEDLRTDSARRACLEVFALRAGETPAESELGYYSARLLLQGRPLTLLIAEVSTRYGVTLGQKLSLQAVPIIGAVTGAALNGAFLEHYRNLAQAHFVIRRLERLHGAAAIRRPGG